MQINEDLSGYVGGIGAQKFRVVVDSAHRLDADSTVARQFALKCAMDHGFAQCGLCESPVVTLIGPNGVDIPEEEALTPGLDVSGFRTTFTFASRY